MNCDAYRILISGYSDGELSEQEMHTLKAHLETCERCMAYLKRMETMKAGLKRYTLLQNVPQVSADFAHNMSARLEEILEQEYVSYGTRLKTAYRSFVFDLVERWVHSLKTWPFAWITSASCFLILITGVAFYGLQLSSTQYAGNGRGIRPEPKFIGGVPESVIRFSSDKSKLATVYDSMNETIEDSNDYFVKDTDVIQIAEEPFIRVAHNDTGSVEDYVYSHVIEVYQDQFVDDAVFVGYVQNAFIK